MFHPSEQVSRRRPPDFDAFVFRNHLRAQQQQRGGHFQAEQHDDGRGERAIHHAHLRQRAEIPTQYLADDFPQQARRGAADQRVLRRQPAYRHEVVDRGNEQDFPEHAGNIDQPVREAAQRPAMSQDNEILSAYRHQVDDHERAHEQRRADANDVAEGQQQRSEDVPPALLRAVQEDHEDRVLQHLEAERAEKQHRDEQHPADHRAVIGWVLLITMLFFSSLGFKVLENAIFVIFLHRAQKRRRHILASLLLPFGYIVCIGAALFVGTFVIADLLAIGGQNRVILGQSWSLSGISHWLIYVAGVIGEILLISAIYYFMPVGRLSAQHALIGGATAGLLWEIIRQVLGWYFGTLSQVSVVYGSLTTAIIVLLSLEVAATLLLLGAQVIAEYERIEIGGAPSAYLLRGVKPSIKDLPHKDRRHTKA